MRDELIDYEAVRQRFPWVGLANTGERDLSSRYREIMAEAQHDREQADSNQLGRTQPL